jgi:hypothetical protein
MRGRGIWANTIEPETIRALDGRAVRLDRSLG